MCLMQKLHDEIKHIEDGFHQFANAEEMLKEKTREATKATLLKLTELESRILAIEKRLDDVVIPNAEGNSGSEETVFPGSISMTLPRR